MSPAGAPLPRLIAHDDPAASAGRGGAVRAGELPTGDQPRCVWIDASDPATALAELEWALAHGADAALVPDLAAALDYLAVHAALHGRAEVDPELALAPELRREAPSS